MIPFVVSVFIPTYSYSSPRRWSRGRGQAMRGQKGGNGNRKKEVGVENGVECGRRTRLFFSHCWSRFSGRVCPACLSVCLSAKYV